VKSQSIVEEAKTQKAGCGIRYDPEQLGEHTGFDFSAAESLKDTLAPTSSKQSVDQSAPQSDEQTK